MRREIVYLYEEYCADFLSPFDCLHIHCKEPHPKSLIERLSQLKIDRSAINKIVIEGDEPSYTSGVSIVITNRYIIDRILSHIDTSKLFDKWVATGNRRMHMFDSTASTAAQATLLINETDMVSLPQDGFGYQCKGLHKYIMKLLAPIVSETNELYREAEKKSKSINQERAARQ